MTNFYLLLTLLLALVTFLPNVIRAFKWVNRNVIGVWANEVSKAWHE